jgi:tetratricopeptide (TPR) repeat protein
MDPNLARRRLRELLFQVSRSFGLELSQIPHSYDTDELLAFAQKILRRRDVKRSEYFHDLIERTGIALAVLGRGDEARALFERGTREPEGEADPARFLYLLARFYHQRRNDDVRARKTLTDAIERMESQRRLKARALLQLGRLERRLGDLETAEDLFGQLGSSGVFEYRPIAINSLALMRSKAGRHDEAVQLNRKAVNAVKRARDEFATRILRVDTAAILLEAGRVEEARRLMDEIANEEFVLFDLLSAGRIKNNMGVALRQSGDPRGARQAFLDAIRFHAAAGTKNVLAGSYRGLAAVLADLGDIEPALSAVARSIEIAEGVYAIDAEFKARTLAVKTMAEHRSHITAIPRQIEACSAILETRVGDVGRDSLEAFSEVMTAVALGGLMGDIARQRGRRPIRVGTSEGDSLLASLLGRLSEDEYESRLEHRLGEGLSIRHSPSPEQIRRFLYLFPGDFFRFRHYAREFLLTTSRAKTQLKELSNRRVVELSGTRKAAKYSLAFHRA